MQIRQKRLQFYPGRVRRFLTLFCVTISDAETPPPPPGVSISGSRGNSVQCHEKILTSSSISDDASHRRLADRCPDTC